MLRCVCLVALSTTVGALVLPTARFQRPVTAPRVELQCCSAADTPVPDEAATPAPAGAAFVEGSNRGKQNDDKIVALTDENGVNALIGRKIENPSDWLEARMEYAKYEDAELGGLDAGGFDRGEVLKIIAVVVGGAYIGAKDRPPAPSDSA